MAELLIVIAAVAIFATIAISAISGAIPLSQSAVANKNLEDLNAAVLSFNQANWELVLTADPNSSADELEIFRSLQYRDGASPSPGAPYINAMYSFVESSDAQTYRASWNGHMFEMISPGTTGIGLDLLQMTGTSQPATFATGYKPVGAP